MNRIHNIDELTLYQEIFLKSPGRKMIISESGDILLANESVNKLFGQDFAGQTIQGLLGLDSIPSEELCHFIDGFPYLVKTEELSVNNYRALFFESLFHDPDPQLWFSDLANFFSEPMWVLNSDLQLLNFNSAFREDVENYIKRKITRGDHVLFPEYDSTYLSFWEDLYNRALQGEKVQYEFSRDDKTQDDYAMLNLEPIIKNGQCIGIACFTKNISSLKKSNNLLVEKTKKLHAAFEIAKMSEWEYDSHACEFTWMEKADQFLGVFDVAFPTRWEEFIKMIHPSEQQGVEQAFDTAAHSGMLSLETKISFNQKDYLWVKIAATHQSGQSGLIGIIQNINEQKHAQLLLAESEKRFRDFVNVAPAIIYQYNITSSKGLFFHKKR